MNIKQIIINKWAWFSSTIIVVLIAQEVAQLKTIFEKIDASCGILGFDNEKNSIDFLTVISFVSSEIGSMNLKHPKGWQGPYLQDNPTIQGKYYQIVQTRTGYYIAPGDGVKLSNGKIIGKDIILNKDTDFLKLLSKNGDLRIRGKALAAKIELGKTEHEIAQEKPVPIPAEIEVQVSGPQSY